MKKYFPFLLLLCISLQLNARTFIHRDGKLLKDSTNATIQLKGVNLGGWLLWEGWIWGGGFTKEGKIAEQLEILTGKSTVDNFRETVYKTFIGEADIKQISALGLNVVRVPFNHRIFDTAYCHAVGWQVLDSLLGWCAKYHVYAVLDMHAAPGGQSHYFIADPEDEYLWKNEEAKQQTLSLWKKIAKRYANNPWVAGYDLLNEPIPVNDPQLENFYGDIIDSIRSVDKNHLLILEGSHFAKKFDFFTSLPDENMAFSFHIYTWFGGKPEDKMATYSELAERLNVPVWCGEWGENNYLVVRETLDAFAAEKENFCGWCFWTWKKAPNSYPALNTIVINEPWSKLIKWCNLPIKKNQLSTDEALKAIQQFEEAIRFQNNRHDDILAKLLSEDAGKR